MSFNSRGCVAVARKKANKNPNGGANLGFEQTLWAAADKLRAANIEPDGYRAGNAFCAPRVAL